jgi:hypothetical protein
MTGQSTTQRRELAQRSNDGIEVMLLWLRSDDEDRVLVNVHDSRDGSSFEIPAEPHLALDVYYHPFAYRRLGTVVDDDSRRTEVVR